MDRFRTAVALVASSHTREGVAIALGVTVLSALALLLLLSQLRGSTI